MGCDSSDYKKAQKLYEQGDYSESFNLAKTLTQSDEVKKLVYDSAWAMVYKYVRANGTQSDNLKAVTYTFTEKVGVSKNYVLMLSVNTANDDEMFLSVLYDYTESGFGYMRMTETHIIALGKNVEKAYMHGKMSTSLNLGLGTGKLDESYSGSFELKNATTSTVSNPAFDEYSSVSKDIYGNVTTEKKLSTVKSLFETNYKLIMNKIPNILEKINPNLTINDLGIG
jgi:hypothetical protein